MSETDVEIIGRMMEYMQNFLEQPHPIFGDMPVCPFAQAARLKQKIFYRVYPFSSSEDLHSESALIKLVETLHQSDTYEALWVIHPDRWAMTLNELHGFVDKLNQAIAPMKLVAFGGHPHEPFNIEGLHTRQEPYINFTVQAHKKVKSASDTLLKTQYYDRWSAENLKQIGLPRENEV
jgi:hypothetical protein